MFIVIRKDAKLSRKTSFVVELLKQHSINKFLYVFKIETNRFWEKWSYDHVQLPSSMKGIIMWYLLLPLRSPEEFRDGMLRRLSIAEPKHVLVQSGFLSMLRDALYINFGTSARANRLMRILNKLTSPKIFLVDEFISLNCLDLKKLKNLGAIIYVSQDIAHNHYGFGKNLITRNLMFRLERNAMNDVDLVVACSEMETLKYLQMGAKKVVTYPNIYPTEAFKPIEKDEMPSVSVVLREHWGFAAEKSLETILNAFACLDRKIRVYVIGLKPKRVPKNVNLIYHSFIPNKMDYLKVLSKSWIGINVGIHKAGTNERKYDYAEAGTVVFSDTLGARGDLIPYEYTYVDGHDFAAKINQLLNFGGSPLKKMGRENRDRVLSLAEKQRRKLLDDIRKIDAGFQ